MNDKKKDFFRLVILLLFSTGLLSTGPFGQDFSAFGQQPSPGGAANVLAASLQGELFPFLVDLKGAPGDTFVDLKWSPFWQEDVKRPSTSEDVKKMMEARSEELRLLRPGRAGADEDVGRVVAHELLG